MEGLQNDGLSEADESAETATPSQAMPSGLRPSDVPCLRLPGYDHATITRCDLPANCPRHLVHWVRHPIAIYPYDGGNIWSLSARADLDERGRRRAGLPGLTTVNGAGWTVQMSTGRPMMSADATPLRDGGARRFAHEPPP